MAEKQFYYPILRVIGIFLMAFALAFAEENAQDDSEAATAGGLVGILSAKKIKANTDKEKKKTDISAEQVKDVIHLLEDKQKRSDLVQTLQTILKAQESEKKQDASDSLDSPHTVLGKFAEHWLLGVHNTLKSIWQWGEQSIHAVEQYTWLEILLSFCAFFVSLFLALGVERIGRRLTKTWVREKENIDTFLEQIKFVFTRSINFMIFAIPLYLMVVMGLSVTSLIKPFAIELVAIIILGRAILKIRGLHYLVKSHAISDVTIIFAIFLMVLLFVPLQLLHNSYIIHAGIYGFVLLGFMLGLRLSLWRSHLKKGDRWLFVKLNQTRNGIDLHKFNDKILKAFSGYVLFVIVILLGKVISGQYAHDVTDYQFYMTSFMVLLSVLMILSAVNFKVWALGKLADLPKQEMIKFYQQTTISVTNLVTIIFAIVMGAMITELWFDNFTNNIFNPAYQGYFRSFSKIIFYLILSRFLWKLIDFSSLMSITQKKVDGKTLVPSQLRQTVTPILRSVGHWLLIIFTFALILEEVGVSILPIIYSISVLGIAISLGAQSLVKDLINGILTLVEGNIAIGEVVTIGQHTGLVESLSLRGVSLRHGSGALQTIPFSEVTNIINKSRDYTTAIIEVPVAFHTKIPDVHQALEKAFQDIRENATFKNQIIEPLTIGGIDRFAENALYITAYVKVKPDPRGKFVKVFNEYLKQHLDEAGIEPPTYKYT
jgi:small-conductance mechanosensitive channel